MDVSKNTAAPIAAEKQSAKSLNFKCCFCPKEYASNQALGGHMSKAHNGKSQAYKHKQLIRESRTEYREFSQKTKQSLRQLEPELFYQDKQAFQRKLLKFRSFLKKMKATNQSCNTYEQLVDMYQTQEGIK